MAKEKIDRLKKREDELKKYGILGKEKVEQLEKERKKRMEEMAKPKVSKRPKPTAKGEAERIKKRKKPSVLPKKDSSFKLRSGNKPSIAKMTGVSPVKFLPAIAKGIGAIARVGKFALRTPAGRRALSKAKNLVKRKPKPKIDLLPPGGGKKKGMSLGTKLTALYGASEVGRAIDKRVQAKNKTNRPSITGKPKTTTPGTPRKNIKPKKSTGITTYRQAYNKMSTQQRSKFKNYADFESQAKSYNRKKYGTINPTATARKQGISKSELAKKNKSMSKKAPKIALKPVKNSRGQNIYVQNNFVGKKAKKV